MNDELLRQVVGCKIRDHRKNLGLTQEELAKAVGKSSATYIALIESGDRNVNIVALMKIAKIFHTSVSILSGEEGDSVCDTDNTCEQEAECNEPKWALQEEYDYKKEAQHDENVIEIFKTLMPISVESSIDIDATWDMALTFAEDLNSSK